MARKDAGSPSTATLFTIAIQLVRLAEETAKPNSERLREYSEAGLDSLKLQLFSDAPIYEDLETVQLADSLGMMAEIMGEENETVRWCWLENLLAIAQRN